MSTYAQLRSGLRDRLNTIAGLHTYLEWPDEPTPPAVLPKLVSGDYERAFGTGGDADTDVTMELVTILAAKGGIANAQRGIELYLDNNGASSIRAAIVGDRSLGGVAAYTFVRGWRGYDTLEVNGREFMGAIVDVEIANDA